MSPGIQTSDKICQYEKSRSILSFFPLKKETTILVMQNVL